MRRIILILTLLAACVLSAQVRKDFNSLEELFKTGKLQEAQRLLDSLKPNKDDERALLQYHEAMLKKSQTEVLALLNTCADKYPKTYYGQLAMLESARLYILDRDMLKAQAQLRRINSPDIVERFYWFAVLFFYLDDFSSAIANAENYLRISPAALEAENALHLVADAYIGQKKYGSAISSLNKIARLQDYDRQYYFFKLGRAHELNGNAKDALTSFREGYELDRYSQIAFNIEERLFALRSRAPSLDLSFLYPYSPLEIAISTEIDTTASPSQNPAEPSVPAPSAPSLAPLDINQPIKLLAKPAKGFFLQAGRFSVEANAERLCRSIRDMRIPASYYEDRSQGQASWVVLAGPFSGRDDTDLARGVLTNGEINSFIVQY